MKLPDKVYDIMKWILLIVVDAFVSLFTFLATTWGWDIPVAAIVGTITAVSAFLGVILGISTMQYNKENKIG